MANNVIDFCIGWGPWPDEPFLETIQQHCRLRRLSCLVTRDTNVRKTINALEAGRRRIRFHLDADADYEDPRDPYNRLGYAAKDEGAFVVNDPDSAKLGINKAVIHYRFERARIPVPYTVVVRNWEPSNFKLTPAERRKLGRPFVIKPARGYGKQGVARVNSSVVKEIAKARRYDRGDDFLLQELVAPEWFNHRMGWFRVFYVLGQAIPCWWDTTTEHYACVTIDEFQRYDLAPLCQILWKIARTTHMNFFSTELALVGKGPKRRFLAIDYINDPCDMTLQSFSHCGVPDQVVHHIAERLVEGACRVKHGLDPTDYPCVWYPN